MIAALFLFVVPGDSASPNHHSATASLLRIKEAVKHMRSHRGVINNEV